MGSGLSTWYAGEVADECTYRRLHKDYKLRKWALASMIACVFVALVGGISLVSFVLDYAEANPTELPDDIMGMLQIPGFLIGTCVMCGCLLICNIPAYFMYWQYFKYIVPQKAVLYFVLACIPGLAKWVLLFAATSESTDFDHYQDPYGTTPLPDANANQDFNEDIPNDRPTETNL